MKRGGGAIRLDRLDLKILATSIKQVKRGAGYPLADLMPQPDS